MRRLLLFAPVLAAGCGFTPVAGTWTYDRYFLTFDDCHVNEEGESEANDIEITITDEGRVRVVLDPEWITECDLDGQDIVSCDGMTFQFPVDETTDILQDLTLEGRFPSETEAEFVFTIVSECEGSLCPALEQNLDMTFPCDTEYELEAHAVPTE